MKRAFESNDQVEISSDDSSSSNSDSDVIESQLQNDEPVIELSPEEWLFRKARSYQEHMKMIPIPHERSTTIPYNSWTGLGSSIKQIYGQPLHYLTNIHLQRLDQQRLGSEDEHVCLDTIIHPCVAESTIWLIEEAHRRTSSPHHLFKLWKGNENYHAFVDAIFPKLGS